MDAKLCNNILYPTVNRTALRCRAFSMVRDGFDTDEDDDSEYFIIIICTTKNTSTNDCTIFDNYSRVW